MSEKIQKVLHEIKTPFSWRRVWLSLIVVIVIVGILLVGFIAYAKSYDERVLPGLNIAEVPIGGMDQVELRDYLEKMEDKLVNEGLRFTYEIDGGEETLIIYPVLVSESNSIELIQLDIEAELEKLLGYNKSGNILSRGWQAVSTRLTKPHLVLENIFVDEARILETLQNKLSAYEIAAVDAAVIISSVSPLNYEVTTSSPGLVFRYNTAVAEAGAAWARLEVAEVDIAKQIQEPLVVKADVESIEERLAAVFDDGSLQLTYTDPHTRWEYEWWIGTEELRRWLEVQPSAENFGFGLRQEFVNKYLQDKIAAKVDVEARDAKFKMENGKVLEFQGSRPGIGLDLEATYQEINKAILGRTWHDEGLTKVVPLVIEQVEPNVKTGDVNDLGISEILGIGVSNFSGSPYNRILNIRNAVNKLNGVLIKPGEEFSTITYTEPFTEAGGYLPELVIKGDEIKPEIGGGLCQIGTTLFRMAMNSAMKITGRRNHSLVVSYYNDPTNGNPGTDATVYDPAPDFKFLNDTDNYVLLQTQMDTYNGKLYFTLWGTNDGRKGYYSTPVVQRWLPYDKESKIVETTDLEPGEEECQHAFTGADASFTYTRELPDKEKEEILYESHYRPLPEICLLGVEKKECEEGDEECEIEEDIEGEKELEE